MAKEVPASWLVLLTILRYHNRECASAGDQTAAPNRARTSATSWAISLDCSGAKLYLPHMLLTPFEDEGRTALIY